MGLADLIIWNQWTIKSLDSELFLELLGAFQPTGGVEDTQRPVLAETVTVGADRPTVQWVAGGARVVRFRSSLVSKHSLDDIGPQLDTLRLLDTKDPTLGRAPRIAFTWSDLEIEGFARVTKRISGFWAVTEWPKRVDFEIEIREAHELDLDGSGDGTGETQYVTLAAGESFEALALRYYGDPIRGDLIRRENPGIAAGEVAGDRVKVLERTHKRAKGTVKPTAPPFLTMRGSSPWAELVEDLAAERGVGVRGLSWDRLPEVQSGEVG